MTKTNSAAKSKNRSYFSEQHIMFRDSLRRFLEKEAVPYFDQWEKDRLVPQTFWRKMGEQGFLCPWVDEKYGGMGADFIFSVILSEELRRIGSGLGGIVVHSSIVAPYIKNFGTEKQKKKYFPGLMSGDTISAIAMTEPGAGSDLASISTTAIKDGDSYIINGQKTFISNGILSDLIVVVCKTDPKAIPGHKGISLFLVESNMPGFSRGRKLDKVGLHSQDTSELVFEDVRVPASNLLGEEGKGFYHLMEELQQERIIAALNSQVLAEQMLSVTLEYVKEREAFGQTISKFQNTQFKLAEMATQVQLGRTFIDDLIVKHLEGQNVYSQVSMAKWWISDNARKMAPECMQLHGGYGYMEEYEIARLYRDVAVAPIYAGSNEIMKVIIAKELGL
ncbi:acyl-CoA dehydrogenase [Sporosarcina sp. P21c]|uniref:acyl-CoA dehydrogenase family protein n=1 Tax=Sporosarcina TaxID=1569 RepID=UPI000A1654F9|nr:MULTISPECIES: acyl-CoA dehydrogenase family protein [Sporosarcina]ARJ37905.1 acyl-CoA dehydrogenase [Sporosarcina ureae]PIC67779.1 acyl-CoA dehydrogenase [Sporosarcina sp. P16a]PIC83772.1 acyl-CoA dehydrogenase [Sporosarcina sp. P1]PIC90638.1 acyl-CoA dehydrogenase [Sporosarcina sp. P21c]PIC93404.1 acyl-CoA dehydrogenase [Sporosarcina sp. P25]